MQTILITGANKGIGLAIAKQFGQRGWHVLLAARDETRGLKAVTELKALGIKSVDFIQLDLAKEASITGVAARLSQQEIDVLVNNAGIPGTAALAYETDLADLRSAMEVNFFGTYQLTKALLSNVRPSAGKIVNITIPTGANKLWNPFAYKATKAAQNVMMAAMAIDFEKMHLPVEIFSIHPGPTTTDLNNNMVAAGFSTADEIGLEIADVILDGKNHQGEMIELHGELK